MGEKGARLTGTAVQVAERLVDELHTVPDVSSKKMFGGVGVFSGRTMFALIDSGGRLFFRVDESTVDEFVAAGSHKHGRMPYWAVPESVLADSEEIGRWAERAFDAARRS